MKKLLSLILTAVLALSLAACSTASESTGQSESAGTNSQSASQATTNSKRNNADIVIPAEVKTIISMSPAVTQILTELGLADKIIAVDTQSPMVATGLKDGIAQMDMFTPDAEKIVSLKPDILFTTNMSAAGGADPFESVRSAGVCVIEITAALSIDDIAADVKYISTCVGEGEKGDKMVSKMMETINKVKDAAKAITAKKTVLFEIAAAPDIYSFGKNVFLNELLEIAGAENVLADQTDWVAVVEEAAVAKNPDVILTSVNYIENPTDEILSRKGWQEVKAVMDKQVYYIDTSLSNLPNHHVAEALVQIAKSVYPEIYKEF